MSDMAVISKLDVIETFKEGLSIGLKNIGAILVNVLLWILTIWIPYLNVGTTIGLTTGIIAKASKGEIIPLTEVFNPRYRKYMGEFFLACGLMSVGILTGISLLIIPGCVIALAWSLALLIVIDKGKNPLNAMSISNHCTYGNKWRMFGVYILTGLICNVGGGILIQVSSLIGPSVFDLGDYSYLLSDLGDYGDIFSVINYRMSAFSIVMSVIVGILSSVLMIGMQASIYKRLTSTVQ